MINRSRRLRYSQHIRDLARETRISEKSLILPLFLKEGVGIKTEIPSLPFQNDWMSQQASVLHILLPRT